MQLEGNSSMQDIIDTLSQEQNEAVQRLIEKADAYGIERLNALYTERNMCVALIARMAQALGFNVGIREDPENSWPIVFVDLPAGQVSWHIPADEVRMHFPELPLYDKPWDGHDTQEKYRRVLAPLQCLPQPQLDPALIGHDY